MSIEKARATKMGNCRQRENVAVAMLASGKSMYQICKATSRTGRGTEATMRNYFWKVRRRYIVWTNCELVAKFMREGRIK